MALVHASVKGDEALEALATDARAAGLELAEKPRAVSSPTVERTANVDVFVEAAVADRVPGSLPVVAYP